MPVSIIHRLKGINIQDDKRYGGVLALRQVDFTCQAGIESGAVV